MLGFGYIKISVDVTYCANFKFSIKIKSVFISQSQAKVEQNLKILQENVCLFVNCFLLSKGRVWQLVIKSWLAQL